MGITYSPDNLFGLSIFIKPPFGHLFDDFYQSIVKIIKDINIKGRNDSEIWKLKKK